MTNNNPNLQNIIGYICIGLIWVGPICMLQPFWFQAYKWSFVIMGIGGAIYIVRGYVPVSASIKSGLKIILIICSIVVAAIGLAIFIAPLLTKML
jgi:hypothetical protein